MNITAGQKTEGEVIISSKSVLMRRLVIFGIVSLVFLAGCGGSTSPSFNNQHLPPNGSNPTPTINTISPNTAVAGDSPFTLMINGTNFVAASRVTFGGTARAATFVSATQLTAAIPASAIASAGTAAVTVTNPAPGGGTSNPVNFTISNPPPTIATISPTSATAGSGTFMLTVNGTNFLATSMVTFAESSATTTFISPTQLTAAISPTSIASVGMVAVTVTNPAPGGGTSNAVNFTITSGTNPVPTINSLDPSCAPVGGHDFTLSVSGSNFVASSVIRWNGRDRPTTLDVIGPPALRAQIPASDIAAAGPAAVTVFNPAPGGGSSNTSTLNIVAGGEYPQSIAVDPTGKFAYVANEGCLDAFAGNVSMYKIDLTTGILTSIGSPVAADFYSHSVTVHPSGKFAYVANAGDPDTGVGANVSMYTINTTTGALTSIGTIDAVNSVSSPWSVAVDPSGKFAYVANAGGFAPTSVSMYTINPTTGALTSIGTIVAGGRATSVAVHPSGQFAYVANGFPGDNVSIYTINATTGALTSIGTVSAGSSPSAIAIDPSGKFAYVTNSNSNDVSMYTINPTTGALTSIGPIAAGTSPASVAVDPTGKFAYVTNSGSNDVSMYTINPTTGALTSIGTIAPKLSPTAIAISPSGKFAYVANQNSHNVSMYSIDGATGTLTLIGTIGT